MTEKQISILSKLIKWGIALVFAVIFIVLLSQYIAIGNLKNSQAALNNTLSDKEQDLNDKQSTYDNIEQNYNQYVEDYAKENLDKAKDGEVRFDGE